MYRILVEKKKGLRIEAEKMLSEINDFLKISSVSSLRVLNGYDVQGVRDEVFEAAKWTVFAEKGLDNVFIDEADSSNTSFVFAVEYLPGQYDQRRDYAEQLLSTLVAESEPVVRCFRLFMLGGNISESDTAVIKNYFINPVESREINTEKPSSILPHYKEAEAVVSVDGFVEYSDDQLLALKEQWEISLSIENLHFCQEYYKTDGKIPTVTELKILDTYWSDHCRHSTFMTVLEDVSVDKHPLNKGVLRAQALFQADHNVVYAGKERPICLMDIATMQMKKMVKLGGLEDMEKSDEVNACSIETKVTVDGKETDYIVMFKNETHNHPTEIEPFGGASTCLGGGIRDPLSGRAHVFGAMRISGCSDPKESFENTLAHKLPQRKITTTAANGYSSYGNQIGLASTYLQEYYDPGFKAKRLECGALVAAVPKANIIRENGVDGDLILLLGGATGKDGFGGATGSSRTQKQDAFTENAAEVQKGNPIVQRGIVRLFRNPSATKLIKKCNDFGAGGVSVAVGELADGLIINLDNVPTKYPGLNGTEIAISESQERMAVMISPKDLDSFTALAAEENVPTSVVATVNHSGRMTMSWRGEEIVNISSQFLNSGGVRGRSSVFVTSPIIPVESDLSSDLKTAWLNNVSDLNVCSKQTIAQQFDMSAGATTVFAPFGGKHQSSSELGLAMRIPLTHGETDNGVVMTCGYNPSLGYDSPFHAGASAVIESVSKAVAMGADYNTIRLSLQEYFESLGKNPEKWGKPYAALMGSYLVQHELNIPAIGGKDSMSGTYMGINVPPSVIAFALSTVDTKKLVSRSFKEKNHKVFMVTSPTTEEGLPDFSVLRSNYKAVHDLIKTGMVKSSSTVGIGGISGAITEMCAGNHMGFDFAENPSLNLFSTDSSAIIIEVRGDADLSALSGTLLGHTTDERSISLGDTLIPLGEVLPRWENQLHSVFAKEFIAPKTQDILPVKTVSAPQRTVSRANVLIPIFPGAIGEYELEKQFSVAGATVSTFIFKNRSTSQTEESYKKLAQLIAETDLVALPSGMTAGGEPDGSGKLISLVLSRPLISNALNSLVAGGGLILGIGEGFKALLQLGLIQNGKFIEGYQSTVNMSVNLTGRYYSGLVRCTVNATGPWCDGGNEWGVVSTREGAVVMDEKDYEDYANKGQIFSHYSDEYGNIASNTTFNPMGSAFAVEGMISENGQILGRTTCVERLEQNLYSNVTDEIVTSPLFANVVDYLKGK